ncbi:MAG: glyoxalase [Saprospiraceae bacterium]
MKTHEQNLLALRPDLQLDTRQSGPEEAFQNQTLRPILKMQHGLLAALFTGYIHKRKDIYFGLAKGARSAWVEHSIRTDLRFRNLLVGTVIGHFTEKELAFYLDNEAENLRRIVGLLVQRLQSVVFVAPPAAGP